MSNVPCPACGKLCRVSMEHECEGGTMLIDLTKSGTIVAYLLGDDADHKPWRPTP